MTDHAVVIAGAGPTGMMLAAELALAHVDCVIVEPQTERTMRSRAGGLHARTIEVLDQRGVADRFLAAGRVMQIQGFAGMQLSIGDFPSRHAYGLALEQRESERILAAWVDELGVPVVRECAVTGFAQHDDGVDVDLSDGTRVHAQFLVGCDGGRSLVRRTAGIEFPGWDATVSSISAEAEWTEEPAWGLRSTAHGTQALARIDDGARAGIVVSEPYRGQSDAPTLDELRAALIGVWGTDFGVHTPAWISRFSDATRQAATYRNGRVLIAGDAAHIHYPVGGQGLNLGVQDAVNLGWKLAQVVRGTSPQELLDTYTPERHPVAARMLQQTMAGTALTRAEPRIDALRSTLQELLALDDARIHVAGMISGLDIRYAFGEGHPLLGRRMPDLDITTARGATRVFTLLHDARPVLLDLAPATSLDTSAWNDRVQRVDASYDGAWELPVIGAVPAPPAVLIRPDGYVAWVGDGSAAGLTDSLTRWFGAPA